MGLAPVLVCTGSCFSASHSAAADRDRNAIARNARPYITSSLFVKGNSFRMSVRCTRSQLCRSPTMSSGSETFTLLWVWDVPSTGIQLVKGQSNFRFVTSLVWVQIWRLLHWASPETAGCSSFRPVLVVTRSRVILFSGNLKALGKVWSLLRVGQEIARIQSALQSTTDLIWHISDSLH